MRQKLVGGFFARPQGSQLIQDPFAEIGIRNADRGQPRGEPGVQRIVVDTHDPALPRDIDAFFRCKAVGSIRHQVARTEQAARPRLSLDECFRRRVPNLEMRQPRRLRLPDRVVAQAKLLKARDEALYSIARRR